MKKVLFILPSYGGGAEKVSVNIFTSLNERKFIKKLLFIDGANFYSDSSSNIYRLGRKSVKSSYFQVMNFIKDFKPDMVFTTTFSVSVMVESMRFLLFLTFEHIVRLPTLPTNCLTKSFKNYIVSFLFKRTILRANLVICQSEEMKQLCMSVYNINKSLLKVVPNLINKIEIETLSQQDINVTVDQNCWNLLYVGSIYYAKGLDLLLRALLKSNISNIHLHVVGRFLDDDKYNKLIIKLTEEINKKGLTKVFLYGYQSNPYVFMIHSDLLILPSRQEGFPNVVIESLNLGTPVLVSNCVDFSSLLTSDIGIVFKKNDINALLKGLEEAFNLKKGFSFQYNNPDYNLLFSK